jgi:hypothetical protein
VGEAAELSRACLAAELAARPPDPASLRLHDMNDSFLPSDEVNDSFITSGHPPDGAHWRHGRAMGAA